MKTVSENGKCVQGSRSRPFFFTTVARGLATVAARTSAILAVAVIAGLVASPARAGFNIPIPDGDFSQTSGDGSIGGALLGGSGTGQIGSGPWTGTYTSALGLILQPKLAITPGVATISGIANVGVLGVVDTTGYFSQTLTGTSYAANTTYTMDATVNVGGLLSVSLLEAAGVGIALTSGGAPLSITGSPLISVGLLSGNNYQVEVQYTTTGTAPTGPIGVLLYDSPSGLATANLFQTVSFSNVTLSSSVPEPSSVVMMSVGLFLAGGFGVRRNRRKRQLALANPVA